MPAIFRDNGTAANWTDTTGANTTFGGNNGFTGVLGSSPSVHINYSGAAYVYEGAKKALSGTATIFQFIQRTATTATIGGGNTIFTVFTSNTYDTSTSPIRIDCAYVDATHFKYGLVDASASYAGVQGSTSYALGVTNHLVLVQTSTGWYLYVNNATTPEVTYTKTQGTLGYQYMAIGTVYQNGAGSYAGVMDFGEFWVGNMAAAPTTDTDRIADAYQGYIQRHLAVSGQPFKYGTDGSNLTYVNGYIDTVSEGVAYIGKLMVQQNDQANLILMDNWVISNFLRSKSTTANTSSNPAPTTQLNLMCFHYNSANTDGKGPGTIYDANFATDADNERGQYLLWAHARWGSSSYTVGSANELVTPNYLQRALNVIADLKTAFTAWSGKQYQWNDVYQTGTTIQIGGDYATPAGFKLFAQYDTANATFWNAAVAGSYDAANKAAAVIFSGGSAPSGAQSTTSKLNPDWYAFNTTDGTVSTSPSTYGDSDYAYNAFRVYPRMYDMYTWYGDSNALTPLRQPKTFFTNEWSANSQIRVTFKHDGTNTGNYEATLFTYAAYWVLYTADTANTTASAILTNKLTLSNLYYQQPYGSIISNGPTTKSYSYYDQSWNLIYAMQKNGTFNNYGQAAAAATGHVGLALMGIG